MGIKGGSLSPIPLYQIPPALRASPLKTSIKGGEERLRAAKLHQLPPPLRGTSLTEGGKRVLRPCGAPPSQREASAFSANAPQPIIHKKYALCNCIGRRSAVPPIFARKSAPRLPVTRAAAPLKVLFGGAAHGGIPRGAFRGAFSLRHPLSAGTIFRASLPFDSL